MRETREKQERFWKCRLLHFFSQRGTYNVAKAEEVNQSEAGSFLTLTDGKNSDDDTSLD